MCASVENYEPSIAHSAGCLFLILQNIFYNSVICRHVIPIPLFLSKHMPANFVHCKYSLYYCPCSSPTPQGFCLHCKFISISWSLKCLFGPSFELALLINFISYLISVLNKIFNTCSFFYVCKRVKISPFLGKKMYFTHICVISL